jgi:hypothetical protein
VTTTPPGWYPDYANPHQLRYWDGHQWTGHTHVRPPAHPGYLMEGVRVQGLTGWMRRHTVATAVIAACCCS